MKYREEEILKQRVEEKKKKYATLEDGYFINNEVIEFERQELLETFTISLPVRFLLMPEELARIKYPSVFRPEVIVTSLDLNVNMGFNVFRHELDIKDSEVLAKRIATVIKGENPDCRFYEFADLELIGGSYFTFRSHGMDRDIYNMLLVAPVNGKMLQVNFNCPYESYPSWQPLVLLIWQTIREIKGEE